MTSVKVRIAVAVNSKGQWCAYGNLIGSDRESSHLAARYVLDGPVVHFVTAELPIPEPVEVAGSVEDGPLAG